MSDEAATGGGAEEDRTGRPGRRRFLSGVGASGLAAAVAVFGRSAPAYATYPAGCCNLACNGSHRTSIGSCQAANHYTWICYLSYYLQCECCEVYGSSPSGCCCGYRLSAYSCSYD